MNKETVSAMAGFVGVAIGLILAGPISVTSIAIILAAVVIFHFLIPAKYNGHFATFAIMFIGGYLLAFTAESTFAEIPTWAAWTWLALSLVVSVFLPIPYPVRKHKSNEKPS